MRLTFGRPAAALWLAAVSLTALAACTASPAPATRTVPTAPAATTPPVTPGPVLPTAGRVVPGTGMATYTDGIVSLRYPRRWRAYPYQGVAGSFGGPDVYLSNDTLRDPCTYSDGGMSASCGEPLSRLSRGGVLIVWGNLDMPGATLGGAPGTPGRLGSLYTRAASGPASGSCRQLRGTWQDDVYLSQSPDQPVGLLYMDACAAPPGISQITRQVRNMLATFRVGS